MKVANKLNIDVDQPCALPSALQNRHVLEPRTPSALDDFLFDLRGYLVLKNAIELKLLDALNAAFDTFALHSMNASFNRWAA